MSQTGKDSGAGLPAAKDIVSAVAGALSISLIAEGFNAAILFEKLYSITYSPKENILFVIIALFASLFNTRVQNLSLMLTIGGDCAKIFL